VPEVDSHNLLFHLTFHHTLHSQQCQNGFYFTNRIPLDDDEGDLRLYMADLITQFNSQIYPLIKSFQNNQVHYNSLIATCVIPRNGPILETIYETGSGDQPDESLPSYCAAILSLRTGLGGKSNRGRLYIAGVSEGDTSAGQLDVAAFAGLQAIANQLLSLFGPTGGSTFFRYVIWSRKLGAPGGLLLPTGIRPILQILPRDILGTQRHRLIGVGT